MAFYAGQGSIEHLASIFDDWKHKTQDFPPCASRSVNDEEQYEDNAENDPVTDNEPVPENMHEAINNNLIDNDANADANDDDNNNGDRNDDNDNDEDDYIMPAQIVDNNPHTGFDIPFPDDDQDDEEDYIQPGQLYISESNNDPMLEDADNQEDVDNQEDEDEDADEDKDNEPAKESERDPDDDDFVEPPPKVLPSSHRRRRYKPPTYRTFGCRKKRSPRKRGMTVTKGVTKKAVINNRTPITISSSSSSSSSSCSSSPDDSDLEENQSESPVDPDRSNTPVSRSPANSNNGTTVDKDRVVLSGPGFSLSFDPDQSHLPETILAKLASYFQDLARRSPGCSSRKKPRG